MLFIKETCWVQTQEEGELLGTILIINMPIKSILLLATMYTLAVVFVEAVLCFRAEGNVLSAIQVIRQRV